MILKTLLLTIMIDSVFLNKQINYNDIKNNFQSQFMNYFNVIPNNQNNFLFEMKIEN